ncbi:MAG: hypothetical protein OHK0039_35730 [Bacteroidia bacterium]
MQRFDRDLFVQLSPPGMRVSLLRFDGSQPGDRVHLRLHLPLLPAQDWISEITEAGDDGRQAWFVDEGRQLPFFLADWRHRHIVEAVPGGCRIVDAIAFRTPRWLPAPLLWPVMWAQFAWRGPVYRRVFGRAGRIA